MDASRATQSILPKDPVACGMEEPGINPLTVQLEDDALHHLTLATFWNDTKGEHEEKRALLLGLLLPLCFTLWFSRHAVLYFRMTQNICTVTTYLQMALQEHKWINISHNKWGYGNTSHHFHFLKVDWTYPKLTNKPRHSLYQDMKGCGTYDGWDPTVTPCPTTSALTSLWVVTGKLFGHWPGMKMMK